MPKGATPRTTPWSAVSVPTTIMATASTAPATPNLRWRSIRFAATNLTWAKSRKTQPVNSAPCRWMSGVSPGGGGVGTGSRGLRK